MKRTQLEHDWAATLSGIKMLVHTLTAITERAPEACKRVTARWLRDLADRYAEAAGVKVARARR